MSVPLQSPASGPVAMNGSGSVDGVFVIPWPVYETLPVGLSGVPPQVQVDVVACADVAPHPPSINDAAAIAVTARIARGLIRLVSLRSRRDTARTVVLCSWMGRQRLCYRVRRADSPGKETTVADTYISL